jgi:predicted outer membrane repeat protein
MRKHRAIVSAVIAAALGLLAACANPFIAPMERKDGPAEGTGLVRIGTGMGAARTALPDPFFDHYEITFSYQGGASQTLTPVDPEKNEYEMAPGSWTVTVKAYAEAGAGSLAAEGSQDFEVILGEEVLVMVTLEPVAGSGKGTLTAVLAYPEGAAVQSFTLARFAGSEDIDLIPAAESEGRGYTRIITVDSGYYLVRAALKKDGVTASKREVAHIYNGMITNLVFEFMENDFTALTVFSSADSGPGSLWEAIANAEADATIALDLPAGDRVIALGSALTINKNLTILGGGATLSPRKGYAGSLVNGSATLVISRIHFKGGRGAATGGAINFTGSQLILESCIFSDNQAGTNGGAIYSAGILRVRGSTFYGNRAGAAGGAIYRYGSSGVGVDLTGNLFYGNTAPASPTLYTATTSSLYASNVSDSAALEGRQISALPLSPRSFKPLGGLGENGAENALAARPAAYPDVDFYGKRIPAAALSAGAAQTATASGHILDYAALGAGTLAVSTGTLDGDGITRGPVTLTAAADSDGEFRGWIVNGAASPEQSAGLTLAMDAHTAVQAVFYVKVSVAGDGGPGSLREAAAKAGGSGIILPPGTSLSLYDDLAITGDVNIEGNGSTLNLGGRHILISGASTKVKINRVHFKGGGAASYGGAIQNEGILSVESCVFSGNQTAGSGGRGGAIYSAGTLTVSGSTFYGNSAGAGQGGAIHRQSGTLTAQGNLFWGNTANSYKVISGSAVSLGFNISDVPKGTGSTASGFNHQDDAVAADLPFSFVSFKPLAGGAAAGAIAARPENYPALDFYGEDIPETDAAVGAAQETVTAAGSILQYSARGPGAVILINGTVDANGFTTGPVTLEAAGNAAASGTFKHWIVDGVQQGDQTPPEQLVFSSISANTTVQAVFSGVYTVSSGDNGGPGSLREALGMVEDGDTIILQGQTVTLAEPLPLITKRLTIRGNGATLTQNGFSPGAASQLLRLGSGANLLIGRVHFKGGRAGSNGGAIHNNGGSLTLESCIFSDNQADSGGGAIYTASGLLNVYGSVFYGNKSGVSSNGAIAGSGSNTGSLIGNIFWGNTPSPVVSLSGTTGSFNVSDGALTGAGTVIQSGAQPFVLGSFKPLAGGAANAAVSSAPSGYPSEDFYGTTIPQTGAAAGAVQATVSGYILDYGAEGPGTVSTEASPNDDGLYSGSLTFTAASGSGVEFRCWRVNGVEQPAQTPDATKLILNLSGNAAVRGVFSSVWTVTSGANDGKGSLREALGKSVGGDRIVIQTPVITLTEPLPSIIRSLRIDGGGAILTQSGFAESAVSQLLRIAAAGAEVRVSRLHFKDGRAESFGAAIYNAGKLVLESCVFSGNKTSSPSALGGAIYAAGTVTVSGSTFVGNAAGSAGGAAYAGAGVTLTLRGNIFWGNAADSFGVVSGQITSGGWNVSDRPGGADAAAGSGWDFAGTDEQATLLPIHTGTFKPLAGGKAHQLIGSTPADYPALDFYGEPVPSNNASAGAAQTAIAPAAGYYALDYGALGPGTVTVASGTPDSDGLFYTGSVTLRAAPAGGSVFIHWTVDGQEQQAQTPAGELTLTLDRNTVARGVFAAAWTVSSPANDGPGSLREALSKALSGDHILLQGQTIVLTAPLPEIDRSLVIEGNGSTLTQSGILPGTNTQLLRLVSTGREARVRVSRLHFKGGRATNYSAAIYNNGGNLTLESCIFTDNSTAGSGLAQAGAIQTAGSSASLAVLGCTFVGNASGFSGGGRHENRRNGDPYGESVLGKCRGFQLYCGLGDGFLRGLQCFR